MLGWQFQRPVEGAGEEVLAQGGVREPEGVVVAAHEERRGAEVFFPQVGCPRRVVQLQLRPTGEELQHPLFDVGDVPRCAAGAPQLRGEVFHQQLFVVREQAVLAVVAFEPLPHERGVEIDGADGAPGEFRLFDGFQLVGDHPQGQGAFGDLTQVVHAVDQVQQPVDVRARDIGLQIGPDLVFVEGEHEQRQVVGAGGAVAVLAGEVVGLVADRAEVVGPARQQ